MKNQFTSAVQRIRVRSRAFTGRHLHPSGDRGIALILTLAIITLVTVLLIAFATSMRVENTASKNFNDLIKSRELAQAAVDQAVATIRQYTTRNAAPDNILNYVTFPGAIYYFDGATTFRKPLYSQHAAGAISTASAPDPFDFNYAVDNVLWITGKGGEFPPGAASEFPVGWVYVAEDGSLAPPLPVPLPRNIVGRFAFWVDDEASKINLNTAGTPTVTTPPPPPPPDFGHSVSNDVDLSVLLGGMGASVAAIKGIQASPGFTTIEEVKLADPSDLDFNANRFSLTTYSSDGFYPNYTDDLDAFGQQRRPLSGAGAVSQPTDIADTITINSAYKRMSDPLTLGKMYSGSTFDAKYGANGLKQIIANIISYQLDPTSTTLAPATDGLTPPGYLGLAKTPYLNEVNIAYTVIDNGDGTFSASRTISVELYYIYSDVTFNSQAGDTITVSALPDSIPTLFPAPPAIPVNGAFLSGGLPRFFTVTQTVPLPLTRVLQPPAGHTIVTYSRGANRLDYSEMDFPQVRLEIGNPGTTIQDVEVDDPAVNDTFNQWTPSSGNGTLGSLNDPSVYKPMDGTVPTGGLPPSKAVMSGKPMQSLGELGYIHLPGVKWKYLTLQPNAVPGVIPDWAMLDLFTVGNTAIPNDVVTGGRININSFINTAVAATPSQPRLVPLEALLKSLSGVIAFPLATVAHQIYNDDDITAPIARLTDPYGMKFVFDTIGEICEINSLMPSGTPKEADKEIAIRRLGNLITVRSNTFTIWVIAQSIKEPTGLAGQSIGMFQPGTDLITGEVRAKAVVERYEQAGVVKFRVRYFRYL